nr:hypothetical protein [Tanacetum cinerariifolium]
MKWLTYSLGKTPNRLAWLSRVQVVSIIKGSPHLHSVGAKQEDEDILETVLLLANSDLLRDQLLIYFDMKTQREVQLATKINNLTRQLLGSIDERRSFIQEFEQRLQTNVMAYKTREELKGLQKDDMIKAMEKRTIAL